MNFRSDFVKNPRVEFNFFYQQIFWPLLRMDTKFAPQQPWNSLGLVAESNTYDFFWDLFFHFYFDEYKCLF